MVKTNKQKRKNGGEAGIRTLGTDFSPYNFLAGSRFRPLSHFTNNCKCKKRHNL